MKYLKKFNEESSKRFTLDDDSESQIKGLVDELFAFCQKNKNSKKFKLFKSINLKTMDGSPFTLPIYVDKNFEGGQAGIGFKDPELDPTRHAINNLHLVINPKYVFSKKSLYITLYHEILHAVDPTITSKYSQKYLSKYGDAVEEPEKYYSHGIELLGMTGEFFEALVQEYTERMDSCENSDEVDDLEDSLDSIVGFFNELHMFNPLAHDILHKMDGIMGLEKTEEDEPDCLVNIDLIRSHSPKGWKMFLTMLYTTSEEIKEMLSEKRENLGIMNESFSQKSNTKELSDGEFLEILKKNCKNFSFSNDQLFRACQSKYPLSIFVETQRMVTPRGGDDVWHGQYPGYADFFRKISKDREKFPVLRTHSLIGSMHGLKFAKDVMSFGSTGYLVIPFDGTKIVLTPYPDLGMATKSLATKTKETPDMYRSNKTVKSGYVDESDFIMVEYVKNFKFPEEALDKINPKVRSHDGLIKHGVEKQGEFFTNGPCLLVSEDKIDWLKSAI